jgi:FHA domain
VKAKEHVDGHDSPATVDDHYRLLRVDPDAPHEVVAEAYWFIASRLRAEMATSRKAERELAALNDAYQVLAIAEQRRAYDATVPRVVELRQQRAEKVERQRRRPLSARLTRKRRVPADLNFYEALAVDCGAEAPLIARAYSILRTLHSQKDGREAREKYLEQLAQSRAVLLDRARRAAYDESRVQLSLAPPTPPAPGKKKSAKAAAVRPRAVKPAKTTAAPGGQSRVGPSISRAFVATGKGSGRLATASGRLGYRGLSLAVKGGTKGFASMLRAGKLAAGGLRRSERAKKPVPSLPDDRLLRDVSSPATRILAAMHDSIGHLVVRGPGGEDEVIDLGEEPVTLGSDRECDVPLAADTGQVAPAHAQIWFTGERFIIRSLDPLHPTILCGQRVNWAGLDDGDEIEIGPHHLRFEAARASDAPPEFLTTERTTTTRGEEIPERQE